MLPASLLLALALVAAPPSFVQLREEGTRAYEAKNWKAACRAFMAAAQLDEKHAQNQADLGLCLGKLGRKAEAIAAQRKAVALGDSKLRLQAYFNLFKLGVKLPLPRVSLPADFPESRHETQCALVAKDACGAIHACTYGEHGAGSGAERYEVGVVLGKDEREVRRAADSVSVQERPMQLALEALVQDLCKPHFYCMGLENDAGVLDEAACDEAVGKCDGGMKHERRGCVLVSADACSGRVGGVCGDDAFELQEEPPRGP